MLRFCSACLMALLLAVGARADEPAKASAKPEPLVKFEAMGEPQNNGWKLTTGADLLILRPHFDSNQALSINSVIDGTLITTFRDFEYDFGFAPRIWAGIENCNGLGFRARFFHFEQSADTVSATVGAGGVVGASSESVVGNLSFDAGPGETIDALTSIYIQNWDLEVTQRTRLGHLDLVLAGGVRYSHQKQTYDAFADGLGIQSSSGFTGVGPTMGVDALCPLGSSKFSVFGSARGSLLFGRGHQEAVAFGDGVAHADSRRFDTEGVLEAEVGLQWERCLGNVQLLVRPALNSQLYIGGGNARGVTDDFGRVSSSDFGLVGAALSAGIRY